MSVEPAAGGIRLNHYFYEVPRETASKLNCNALKMNVLEKICWVAFAAIIATVFTVSLAGIVLAGHGQLILTGMALASPLLGLAASHFNSLKSQYAKQAAIETGVADQLDQIAHWEAPQIHQFFEDNRIIANAVAVAGLEFPTRFLPLIARFKFVDQLGTELKRVSSDLLMRDVPLAPENSLDESQKRFLRLTQRRTGWQKYECEALPLRFQAAAILQIIQYPHSSGSLADRGFFVTKAFDERLFDRTRAPVDDDYFCFRDPNRATITLVEADRVEPRDLRPRLFG